eukprot:913492-Prymnesium_polylepis.2
MHVAAHTTTPRMAPSSAAMSAASIRPTAPACRAALALPPQRAKEETWPNTTCPPHGEHVSKTIAHWASGNAATALDKTPFGMHQAMGST